MAKGQCISCQGENLDLNENNVCDTCAKELEEVIVAVVENNNDNNSSSDEIVDSGSDDNFETTVKERNKQAEEAQEILSPQVEELEEPKPKKWTIAKIGLLIVGTGLVGVGVLGAVRAHKTAQNAQIAES